MKIHIPGIGTQYVDEAPPAPVVEAPSISVEDAIKLAQQRAGIEFVQPPKTEVLQFTRERGSEAPLVDNSKGVSNPDNISGQLEHGAVPTGTSEQAPAGDPASDPLTQ